MSISEPATTTDVAAPPALDPPDATTRTRLVHAAASVLSRNGYAKAHLADIAELADLKAPAVYYHFDSRDDLITAALREGQVIVREHVAQALQDLPPSATPNDRILAAVEAHLRIELELSDLASAVVRTARHVPQHIRDHIDGDVEAYYDVWRTLLHDAEAAGTLRPDLHLPIARMLVIGSLNWATEWRDAGTPIDDVVRNARHLIAGALFPHR